MIQFFFKYVIGEIDEIALPRGKKAQYRTVELLPGVQQPVALFDVAFIKKIITYF